MTNAGEGILACRVVVSSGDGLLAERADCMYFFAVNPVTRRGFDPICLFQWSLKGLDRNNREAPGDSGLPASAHPSSSVVEDRLCRRKARDTGVPKAVEHPRLGELARDETLLYFRSLEGLKLEPYTGVEKAMFPHVSMRCSAREIGTDTEP